MAIFSFVCENCKEPNKSFNPTPGRCPHCGGQLVSTKRGPSNQTLETKDDGYMTKSVVQLMNEEDLLKEHNANSETKKR